MYELKTLLPQFQIDLPACMYQLKNVGLAANACEELCSATCDPASLMDKQRVLFEKLQLLQTHMASIRAKMGLCQKGKQPTNQSPNPPSQLSLREEHLHELVINAHPRCIPYGLLALKNAWRGLFSIKFRSFTHSTMAEVGPEAQEFARRLTAVDSVDETTTKVDVTFIWKNCDHTEMFCSPMMYAPIYGEVNIMRYFGRIGPAAYRYENLPLCNEIDAVLDISYQLLRCSALKDKIIKIRALANRLQKQKFFAGDEISVADIGVYSSLKRMPLITDKELPQTLREWRQRTQVLAMV